MTKIKASGADGIYIGGVSTNNGGQLIKDKVAVVGDNEAVKLLVSDGFVLSSLFEEAGRQRRGRVRHGPDAAARQAHRRGQGVRRRVQPSQGGQDDPGLHDLRGRGRAGRCSTRSAAPTARARTSSRSCSRRTSPTRVVGAISFNENGDPAAGVESVYKANGRQLGVAEEKQVD